VCGGLAGAPDRGKQFVESMSVRVLSKCAACTSFPNGSRFRWESDGSVNVLDELVVGTKHNKLLAGNKALLDDRPIFTNLESSRTRDFERSAIERVTFHELG